MHNRQTIKLNIFRHSILFLLGFIIVHFQYLLEFAVTNEIVSPVDIWVDERQVSKSLVISSFGLLFFCFGFDLYKRNKSYHLSYDKSQKENVNVSFLILLSYICFFGFLYTVDGQYLAGYYGRAEPGVAAARFQIILSLCISASIIIKVYYRRGNSIKLMEYVREIGSPLNLIILSYVSLVLFIGDRGPALSLILLYFGGFVFITKTKPRAIFIIFSIILGVFLMTVVRNYRGTDKMLPVSERLEIAFFDKESSYSKGGVETDELAGSVRTLHYAVSNVPNNYDFQYGWYQIRQLLIVIPGMASILDQINPTYIDKGSTKFITYLDQGSYITYGLGTSIIADFYIDLGLIGVILGMFLLGMVFSRMEIVAFSDSRSSLFFFVCMMIYLSKTIYLSRSTALFPLQEVVWVYVIVILNNHFFNSDRRLKRGKSA